MAHEMLPADVEAVMTTVVVHCGETQAKAFPVAELPDVATHGVGLSPVADAFDVGGSIDTDQSLARPDGDLRLIPDLGNVRFLGGIPGWAWAPADRYHQDGSPYEGDQRLFLRRMLAAVADAGLSASAGFEIEWNVGLDRDEFVPGVAGSPYSAQRLLSGGSYANDVMSALATAGVPVQQFHAENAPGQLEVSLPPRDPLTAADDVVLAKLVIAAVTDHHGLRPTFSPVVAPGLTGNGGHLHVSFARDGVPLFGGGSESGGLTSEGASMVAGLLRHLPGLLAVTAPLEVSYLRLQPHRWAGAFQVWGVENREAPLRLIPGGAPVRASLEIKCADLVANPYLFVGSALALALSGLREPNPLPEPVVGDPADGDHPRLPAALGAAVDRFRADEVLRTALGEQLHRTVAENRDAEVRRAASLDVEDLIASTRWWR
ncbi:MAG: glutamine synthetase family protein [Candidatus Nanopelagicales bacterium]